MKAKLVCDGKNLFVPEVMGKPKDGQLTGTMWENLGELAGRICYDSLGSGRNSADYHKHILEVKNHSVYEHLNITISLPFENEYAIACLNRKGLWVKVNGQRIEVTCNPRAVLEWDRWNRGFNESVVLKGVLAYWWNQLAPMIVNSYEPNKEIGQSFLVEELDDDQAWISMYLSGSRGWSHEQVRHRFAISQRSTRYVDESESEYIMHPLVRKWLEDESVHYDERQLIRSLIKHSEQADKAAYKYLVEALEKYSNRKQARGAARGYLGNALATEMIYSAPVSGWKWIISNRLNPLADGEIREVYVEVLEELKASHRFEYELAPSPDGIGMMIV